MTLSLLRRTLLASGAALGLTGVARAAPPAPPEIDLKALLKQTGAPAVAGMIVTRDGISYLEAAGVRRLGAADPVTKGDLWHIGSNTKAMTAALYGRLVEQGKARWGATIPALFPDLKPNAAWSAITIEQLLNHHAGIDDAAVLDGAWLQAAHASKETLTVQRTGLARTVLGAPPKGKVGVFAYSNVGYILAGAAIERISGKGWEETITAELFQPLGMTTAGFGAPKGAQPWGHQELPPLTPVDPAGPSDNSAALGPAGTVHLSLTDYAKFIRLFLTDGGDLLKPETIRHLTTPAETGDSSYGLGWITFASRPWAKGQALAHEGSNTLWHAFTAVGPAAGVGVVGVSNASDGGGAQASQTLGMLLIGRASKA